MPLFPGRNIEGGEGMAFQELQAMQVAYELLSPLDPSAQQRVMAWLSAALADQNGAPTPVDEPAAPVKPAAEVPAAVVPAEVPAAEVPAEVLADAAGDGVAEVPTEQPAAVPGVETTAPTTPIVEPVAAVDPEVTAEPEPEPAPRPRAARSAKAAGRRATKSAESAAAQEPAEGVPGRRGDRPSGEQFLTDLAAAGSFKALAEKYGKSIGTIGNWANQLREQGFDIPVGRQKKA
jgi:hypothetical protein